MGRVLVVDDDAELVRLVSATLQAQGFEVASASNGAECLLAVASQRPDLIVLDIAMPVLDGFETLRLLRAKPETGGIPVIILTGRKGDADVARAWATAADFYLTKPFDAQELVTAVKRMIEAESGAPAAER